MAGAMDQAYGPRIGSRIPVAMEAVTGRPRYGMVMTKKPHRGGWRCQARIDGGDTVITVDIPPAAPDPNMPAIDLDEARALAQSALANTAPRTTATLNALAQAVIHLTTPAPELNDGKE